MRASVRNCLLAVSASLAAPGAMAPAATNGLFLPSAPTGAGGEDAIETSTGTRCRQSINSNGAYLDVGVTGTTGSPIGTRNVFTDARDQEATAYARVTIPLGRRPERINCNRVYELEIEKLQREVELLRLGAR